MAHLERRFQLKIFILVLKLSNLWIRSVEAFQTIFPKLLTVEAFQTIFPKLLLSFFSTKNFFSLILREIKQDPY